MNRKFLAMLTVAVVVVLAFSINILSEEKGSKMKDDNEKKEIKSSSDSEVQLSEEEWKNILTPEQYRVIRQCSTEPPFSGKYYNHHDTGTYACAACGNELFLSDAKYESGSGWPSFWQAVDSTKILEIKDTTLGMIRTEIKCRRCEAHLGHVFDDGPPPTGLRYCVNSASLKFVKKGEENNKMDTDTITVSKNDSK